MKLENKSLKTWQFHQPTTMLCHSDEDFRQFFFTSHYPLVDKAD